MAPSNGNFCVRPCLQSAFTAAELSSSAAVTAANPGATAVQRFYPADFRFSQRFGKLLRSSRGIMAIKMAERFIAGLFGAFL